MNFSSQLKYHDKIFNMLYIIRLSGFQKTYYYNWKKSKAKLMTADLLKTYFIPINGFYFSIIYIYRLISTLTQHNSTLFLPYSPQLLGQDI